MGEGAPDGCLGVLSARRQLDSQGRTCTDGDGALARCACSLCGPGPRPPPLRARLLYHPTRIIEAYLPQTSLGDKNLDLRHFSLHPFSSKRKGILLHQTELSFLFLSLDLSWQSNPCGDISLVTSQTSFIVIARAVHFSEPCADVIAGLQKAFSRKFSG